MGIVMKTAFVKDQKSSGNPTQPYSARQTTLANLIDDYLSGQLVIPNIQRNFVWDAKQVPLLIDSIYRGYPINPIILHKRVIHSDGEFPIHNTILYIIDGRQRITSLLTALKQQKIIDKNFKKRVIAVAFNPLTEQFALKDSREAKSTEWIPDISVIFNTEDPDPTEVTERYFDKNRHLSEEQRKKARKNINKLSNITRTNISIIELSHLLPSDVINDIFKRINSGKNLKSTDFLHALVASNESHKGSVIADSIRVFTTLFYDKDILDEIEETYSDVFNEPFYKHIIWVPEDREVIRISRYPKSSDIYRMLAFLVTDSAQISSLSNAYSGINPKTRNFEYNIMKDAYSKTYEILPEIFKRNNWLRLTRILNSAGFINKNMIFSLNNLNFIYALMLQLLNGKDLDDKNVSLLRRLFAALTLTSRYDSGDLEMGYTTDWREFKENGLESLILKIEKEELHEGFWSNTIMNKLSSDGMQSSAFVCFLAAQVRTSDRAFLTSDTRVRELLITYKDFHHIYPKSLLKEVIQTKKQYYNQIANIVVAPAKINRSLPQTSPHQYLNLVLDGMYKNKVQNYISITTRKDLERNLLENCIPIEILERDIPYQDFLELRKVLMAQKIKEWYYSL